MQAGPLRGKIYIQKQSIKAVHSIYHKDVTNDGKIPTEIAAPLDYNHTFCKMWNEVKSQPWVDDTGRKFDIAIKESVKRDGMAACAVPARPHLRLSG